MIIGLGYKARSGKSTVGTYLWTQHIFTRVAFADKLKRCCMEVFGLSRDQVYGDDKEIVDTFWKDTPRNILQTVGTECFRRGYQEDVWIRALERTIQSSPKNDYVVEDVRFPNEADAVKQWGGFVVRVDRPGAPGIATAQHASETSMANYQGWDYVLDNSKDLPQLWANIEVMMKKLKER